MTTKTENAPETNAFSTLGAALESAAEKFQEGSAVARQSAKQAAKVTRNLFVEGIYKSEHRQKCASVDAVVRAPAVGLEIVPFEEGPLRGN